MAPAQLRASLDALTEDALRPLAGAMTVLFACYAVVYGVQLDQRGSGFCAVMSMGTSLLFLGVLLALRRGQAPGRWVGPLGGAYGLVVGLNCLLSEAVTHNAQLSPNLMLCIVAGPLVILDLMWLSIVTVSLAAGWFVVQAVALPGTQWQVQTYPLVLSVVVAGLVYGVRLRSHRRFEEVRLALRRAAVLDACRSL